MMAESDIKRSIREIQKQIDDMRQRMDRELAGLENKIDELEFQLPAAPPGASIEQKNNHEPVNDARFPEKAIAPLEPLEPGTEQLSAAPSH
ncbi:MAG: hypothetical protein ABGY96_13125 [bacterium]|nr:hypothetical protein [Gammaproteobacteria bacterium]